MKLAPYIACICEGSAESAIIDILVDNNLLIFTREDMLEENVILHRKTIPPQKKKPTVGKCEGRVAKQRKSPALKNRISEIKEAHLVTIRLA